MDRHCPTPADLTREAQGALLTRAARDLAASGVSRIALWPAGAHTRAHGVSRYTEAGLRVLAIVDDYEAGAIEGVPIVTPAALPAEVEALIVSSDLRETYFAREAQRVVDGHDVRIVRPYSDAAPREPRSPSDEIQRLRATCTGRLNLGCGEHPLEGWTNIDGGDGEWYHAPARPDVISLDVFRALAALPDASCTRIYSEHFYEHFTLQEGYDMACEWRRLLAPGGVVRIVTPDLARMAKDMLGLEPLADAHVIERHRRRWLGTRHAHESSRFLTQAMVMNFAMRLDGHKFVYDEQTLRAQLEHAGLQRVRRCAFGESGVPGLRGIDRHDGGETGGAWLKASTLVMEAERVD